MDSLAKPSYLVFYDGHCRLCTDSVRTLKGMDPTEDVRFVDIQQPGVFVEHPQIDPAAALGQMHVITPAGKVAGGFDAIVELMPAYPTLKPFHPLASGPLMRHLGSKIYRWVARNRYRIAGTNGCVGGACELH
jgi:predicted DCC family thiol-disulfide oxidoreductase YuxK